MASLFTDDGMFDDDDEQFGTTSIGGATATAAAEAPPTLSSDVGEQPTADGSVSRKRPRDDDVGEEGGATNSAEVPKSVEVESAEVDAASNVDATVLVEESPQTPFPEAPDLESQFSTKAVEEEVVSLQDALAKNRLLQRELSRVIAQFESEKIHWETEKISLISTETARLSVAPPAVTPPTEGAAIAERIEMAHLKDEALQMLILAERESRLRVQTAAELACTHAELEHARRAARVYREVCESISQQQARAPAVGGLHQLSEVKASLPTCRNIGSSAQRVRSDAHRAATWLELRADAISSATNTCRLPDVPISDAPAEAAADATTVESSTASSVSTSAPSSSELLLTPDQLRGVASLLTSMADEFTKVADKHDQLARFAATCSESYHALQGRVRTYMLDNLEPRIALIREVVDRCLGARAPTAAEVHLQSSVKQLEEHVVVLESILNTFVLKREYGVTPQAVVPQVLKEKTIRCEQLEQEVSKLRGQILVLHRWITSEGKEGVLQFPEPTALVQAGASKRELLLQSMAERWYQHALLCLTWAQRETETVRSLAAEHARITGEKLALEFRTRTLESLLSSVVTRFAQELDLNSQHASVVAALRDAIVVLAHRNTGSFKVEVDSEAELGDAHASEMITIDHSMLANYIAASQTLAESSHACVGAMVSSFKDTMAGMETALAAHLEAVQRSVSTLTTSESLETACEMLRAADLAVCEMCDLQPKTIDASYIESLISKPSSVATVTWKPPASWGASTAALKPFEIIKPSSDEGTKAAAAVFRETVTRLQQRVEWLLSQPQNRVYADVESLSNRVNSLSAELAACKHDLQTASAELSELRKLPSIVTDRDARVSSLESQLRVSQENLAKTRQDFAQLQKRFDEGQTAMSSAVSKGDSLRLEVESLRGSLEARSGELRVAESSIASLNAELIAASETIRQLQSVAAEPSPCEQHVDSIVDKQRLSDDVRDDEAAADAEADNEAICSSSGDAIPQDTPFAVDSHEGESDALVVAEEEEVQPDEGSSGVELAVAEAEGEATENVNVPNEYSATDHQSTVDALNDVTAEAESLQETAEDTVEGAEVETFEDLTGTTLEAEMETNEETSPKEAADELKSAEVDENESTFHLNPSEEL